MNENTDITPKQPTLSGHEDPDGEAPWAMQLVVRADKSSLPAMTDVCAAAATAVVSLLDDPRAADEWAPAIERWTQGRIRKICRRARGAAWDTVGGLPGVTATVGTASVRAFVPGPTDAVPRELSKLQVRGLDLAPAERYDVADVPDGSIVVAITPLFDLGAGKAAAAAGHAAQLAWMQMTAERRGEWRASGFAVHTEHPTTTAWPLRLSDPVVVADAGFTVVPPGTVTATARW